MSWAQTYLGIPFVDRGETRSGCDCWGLLKLILKEQCGYDVSAHEDVEAGDMLAKVRKIMRGAEDDPQWQRVEKEQAFDGVLMRGQVRVEGRTRGRPIHVGVVVQPGTLIHVEHGSGVTIVDYKRHPMIKNRVLAFYRFRNG